MTPRTESRSGSFAFLSSISIFPHKEKKLFPNYCIYFHFIDVYKRQIQYIACGLINVINIFQPEVLCIGGGICKEGDTLLKPLEAHICLLYTSACRLGLCLSVAPTGWDTGFWI